MAEQSIACHRCGHVWSFEPPLGRRDDCPKCHSDARVCMNCRHYDRGSHHECREEQAEWVKEKGQGNFCGYFTASSAASRQDQAANAKAKLDALFGKSATPEAPKPGASLAEELARFMSKGGK